MSRPVRPRSLWAKAPNRITFSSEQITIKIDRQTLAFSYFDSAGKLLTKEPAEGGKYVEPVQVVVHQFDPAAEIRLEHSPDGEKVRVQGTQTTIQKEAFHGKLSFDWAQDEALYGLGSRQLPPAKAGGL